MSFSPSVVNLTKGGGAITYHLMRTIPCTDTSCAFSVAPILRVGRTDGYFYFESLSA